ncbi:hypothetical protein CFAM422_008716 [Trichoderma lentiforme]|uniref:SnoaL-like domain-containing protein n=1 Tax=Trichoderma lentiforme TaxID=1567552 RepID=A0A9P5C9U6_9HYPO|nr:hypothetical protein CFAM422_008716 [Trichoderma lentiforme]
MPQHMPAAIGAKQLRDGYRSLFSVLKYDLSFTILETVVVSEEWAFARSETTGSSIVGGNGMPEANKELFVLKKVDGEWLIARYCMCTSRPALAK